jgi:membrane protease YdiL (CAAX protease family)
MAASEAGNPMNDYANEPETQEEASETRPGWTWVDLLLILLGFGGIFTLGWFSYTYLLTLSGGEFNLEGQPSILQSIGLAALEAIALVGSVYFLGIRRKGLSWKSVGIRPIGNRWLLRGILISLLAIPITGLITVIVLQAFDLPFQNPQLDFLLPEGITLPGAIGLILVGGIAVPFAEELFFRGVLYTWFRKHWSIWPSVIVNALIFGVAHFDIAVGLTAFVLGLVLALVYEYSRSLWSSVLIHALNNSLRLILLYILVALGLTTGL